MTFFISQITESLSQFDETFQKRYRLKIR